MTPPTQQLPRPRTYTLLNSPSTTTNTPPEAIQREKGKRKRQDPQYQLVVDTLEDVGW
jgi:hypothetical protein